LDGWRVQEPSLQYIPDFLHVPTSTIIEVDGGYHNELEQRLSDDVRTGKLSSVGYVVLRFTNDEVTKTLDNVIDRIAAVIRHRSGADALAIPPIDKGEREVRPEKRKRCYKRWNGREYVKTDRKPDIMNVALSGKRWCSK
jgi:hypothetical protein